MVGKSDYQAEKEARERRLMAYAEAIKICSSIRKAYRTSDK